MDQERNPKLLKDDITVMLEKIEAGQHVLFSHQQLKLIPHHLQENHLRQV